MHITTNQHRASGIEARALRVKILELEAQRSYLHHRLIPWLLKGIRTNPYWSQS